MQLTPKHHRLADPLPTPLRGRPRALASLLAVPVLLALLACLPATAAADAPPGPPGPPPGNGTELPPPPGTAPTVVPPGTPAAVPTTVTGPGRLTGGTVQFNRFKGTFSLFARLPAERIGQDQRPRRRLRPAGARATTSARPTARSRA